MTTTPAFVLPLSARLGGRWTTGTHVCRHRTSLVSTRTRSVVMTMSATDAKGGHTDAVEGGDTESTSLHDGEFLRRFGDLRGKPVEPVSASVARFNELFGRPIPIVYRGLVMELITTTHLAVVCAMWRFDAVFALGFDATFTRLMKYYPDAAERDTLYAAACGALKLDVAKVKREAAVAREWIEGKTGEQVLNMVNDAKSGGEGVLEALTYIRDAGRFDWYYSRLFGIGLIEIMTETGAELSGKEAERWANKIGLDTAKFGTEMGTYLAVMERLKQAEQIFAEAAAREAKKTAERLAEKAQKAVKEAEMLEKGEEVPTEVGKEEIGG